MILPDHFSSYRLLDSGHGRKLERFGEYILIRPEQQAVWEPNQPEQAWLEQAHAVFEPSGPQNGKWRQLKKIPQSWRLTYQAPDYSLKFKLSLTAFKHVGIFPEQAINWDYAYAQCRRLQQPRVLNLFAYTGGASMACAAAGAQVTHVDSIKQVVNWANENVQLSKLDKVRWIVEDALKFVQRAARNGHTYEGVMMDPPAFGHGPRGQRWKLEELITELTQNACAILNPERGFMVFNAYSMGYSPSTLVNLIRTYLPQMRLDTIVGDELLIPEQGTRRCLQAGISARLDY